MLRVVLTIGAASGSNLEFERYETASDSSALLVEKKHIEEWKAEQRKKGFTVEVRG
jgi:hypothetical protein